MHRRGQIPQYNFHRRWQPTSWRKNSSEILESLPSFRRNPDPSWGPELYDPLSDKGHPFKDESKYQRAIKPFYRKNPGELSMPYNRHYMRRYNPMDIQDCIAPPRRRHFNRYNPVEDMDEDLPTLPAMDLPPTIGRRHFNRYNPEDEMDTPSVGPLTPLPRRHYNNNPHGWRTMWDPLFGGHSRRNPIRRYNPAMPWRNRSNPRMMFDPLFRNPSMPWRNNRYNPAAMPWRGRYNPAMPWRNRANPDVNCPACGHLNCGCGCNPVTGGGCMCSRTLRGRNPITPWRGRHNPAMPWRNRSNPRMMYDPLFRRNLYHRSNPEDGVGLYRSIFS